MSFKNQTGLNHAVVLMGIDSLVALLVWVKSAGTPLLDRIALNILIQVVKIA